MAYHAALYVFVFLPACLVVYQAAPQKHRWKVLLGISWLFFYLISGKLIVYLIGTTLLTHYTGIWLALLKEKESRAKEHADRAEKREIKKKYQKQSREVLAIGVVLLLAVLVYLKYYNFFIENASIILDWTALPLPLEAKQMVLPIGISFYTLQAIGYMADVYWGKIRAEENIFRTALFLSFFPHIMEGPICRYADTAGQLFEGKSLAYENISDGYVGIFWGLFKKKVVADRLSVPVCAVFEHYGDYHGAVIAVAAVAYTIQLYMEFSGCMDIVLGSGKLFGICLPENFRQPFCAKSAAEFWRRWHISLGTWFKTYIFYPVSMSGIVKKWNQFGKKHAGKYVTQLGVSAMALFPVWLCNGLWHGARWSYIFYGMYYFALILMGIAVKPGRDRILKVCHIREDAVYWRIIQTGKTWVIIFTGELFFRANGLKAGLSMFGSMFDGFDVGQFWDGTMLNLGLSRADLVIVAAGCIAVAVVGHFREQGGTVNGRLGKAPTPVRWFAYYALIFAVLIFGAYGDGYQAVDLIYAGF